MKFNKLSIAALTAFIIIGLTACEKKGPAEQVGENIDNAAENFGDKMEDATEDAGDKLEAAGDKVEDATDKPN